ncbi:MAG: hypothetical protein AB2L22_15490 [Syntrophales bacterium]
MTKFQYLSPAFSKQSEAEKAFLGEIGGATGFSLFWLDLVKPLLERTGARNLLQIGAYKGEHTRLLLEYCRTCEGFLTVVEPFVLPVLEEIMEGSVWGRLVAKKSHDAIPGIMDPMDAVLLNGDINYHAARMDLQDIAEMAERAGGEFPLIVLKSMSWPYARRDMYYDPESVPPEARHEYERMGMSPWSPGLEENAINAPFFNARQEGGPRNGVRTAVEDFIASSRVRLELFTLPINHGLGIIYRPDSPAADFIGRMLKPPPALEGLLETWEIARLNDIMHRLRPQQNGETGRLTVVNRMHRIVRCIISRILPS